ncbi:nuclear transport factor 2 family protein [Pseudanabaena sp. PCC 6802]|uniref:nuclear transport factor 2 family protein n=1 Tax=Pseudanabaena sp. PCC 6802 TaxID=118173 RepID=UPI000347ED14|nr:nuclear transport factor 2 family protein [Pseudanabaena sp. PCC 6802]
MSTTNIDLVNRAYAAVEVNNVDEYVSYFTDDAIYKVGNFDPVIGPEGIRALATPLVDMFDSVTHDVLNIWEFGDTVVCEMNVTYNRKDGKVATLPCVDVIHFANGKVRELKAYIDTTPAFT